MRHALRLEIPADTLLRLLANGQLCAADVRCLDFNSKKCLWRLLLVSIDKAINVVSGCNGRCSECANNRDKSVADSGRAGGIPGSWDRAEQGESPARGKPIPEE